MESGLGEPGRLWAVWEAELEQGAGQQALPQPILRGQAGAPGGRLSRETMKEPSASQ